MGRRSLSCRVSSGLRVGVDSWEKCLQIPGFLPSSSLSASFNASSPFLPPLDPSSSPLLDHPPLRLSSSPSFLLSVFPLSVFPLSVFLPLPLLHPACPHHYQHSFYNYDQHSFCQRTLHHRQHPLCNDDQHSYYRPLTMYYRHSFYYYDQHSFHQHSFYYDQHLFTTTSTRLPAPFYFDQHSFTSTLLLRPALVSPTLFLLRPVLVYQHPFTTTSTLLLRPALVYQHPFTTTSTRFTSTLFTTTSTLLLRLALPYYHHPFYYFSQHSLFTTISYLGHQPQPQPQSRRLAHSSFGARSCRTIAAPLWSNLSEIEIGSSKIKNALLHRGLVFNTLLVERVGGDSADTWASGGLGKVYIFMP